MKTVCRRFGALVAVMLICSNLSTAQTSAQVDKVKAQVAAFGRDRLVEVRTIDGPKMRGWIGTISDSGFELKLAKARLEGRQVAYDQIRSIKAVESVKPSHTTRNILIGVAIAVAAIGIGITIAASKIGYI